MWGGGGNCNAMISFKFTSGSELIDRKTSKAQERNNGSPVLPNILEPVHLKI